MASTVFTDHTTVIVAAWCNDVNGVVYGTGTTSIGTVFTQTTGTTVAIGTVAHQTGTGAGIVVAGEFQGYADTGGGSTCEVWGIATEAWTGTGSAAPSTACPLMGAETSVIAQYNANTYKIAGLNSVFKNRPDSLAGGAVRAGLGSNQYNYNSVGVWITSQARSSAGEYCGFSRGIQFDTNSLDTSTDGVITIPAVGIDFGDINGTVGATLGIINLGSANSTYIPVATRALGTCIGTMRICVDGVGGYYVPIYN